MTKVFAINGSPEMEKGNTALILSAFLDGTKEAGATVELFYAKRLNIKDCVSDFDCWWKKPGECIINDDMQMIYPKIREADILVLATPVYIPLPGAMQNFLNRFCPLMEPAIEWREGRTRARFHDDVKIRRMVLVSTCGWWEIGNFDTVLRIAEELAKNVGQELAAAVLRPHAFLMAEFKEKAEEVIEATKQAGFQLVKEGRISKSVLDSISQPFLPEEELRQWYNDTYNKAKNRKHP
jgi:multimeric flavodoxin WrbA